MNMLHGCEFRAGLRFPDTKQAFLGPVLKGPVLKEGRSSNAKYVCRGGKGEERRRNKDYAVAAQARNIAQNPLDVHSYFDNRNLLHAVVKSLCKGPASSNNAIHQ